MKKREVLNLLTGKKETGYKIPFSVWFRDIFDIMNLPIILAFILVLLALLGLIPKEIYYRNEWFALVLFGMIVLAVIVIFIFPNRYRPALRKWVFGNVRCPVCRGKLKSFKSVYPGFLHNDWVAQCGKCNRKFLFRQQHPSDLGFDENLLISKEEIKSD